MASARLLHIALVVGSGIRYREAVAADRAMLRIAVVIGSSHRVGIRDAGGRIAGRL